ncbi:hypothetical protein DSUL_160098 [Desulfovibrionales bacterium]
MNRSRLLIVGQGCFAILTVGQLLQQEFQSDQHLEAAVHT